MREFKDTAAAQIIISESTYSRLLYKNIYHHIVCIFNDPFALPGQ